MKAIENNNGTNITNVKRINQNTLIWVRHISNVYNPPANMVNNVEWVVTVQYCTNDIVTIGTDQNGITYCYINNGGCNNKTTKEYINAALTALCLQYYLRIKNHRMQLINDNGDDEVVPDFNGSYLITF